MHIIISFLKTQFIILFAFYKGEGTVEDDDVQHGTSKPFASTEPITSDHNNKLYVSAAKYFVC